MRPTNVQSRTNRVQRAAGDFRGVFATTPASVRRLFGSPCMAGLPVVADLSLGSWKACSAARQLAGQLGIELPLRDASRYRTLSRAGLSYGALVSYGIDAEALGDRTVDTAIELARLLRRAAL